MTTAADEQHLKETLEHCYPSRTALTQLGKILICHQSRGKQIKHPACGTRAEFPLIADKKVRFGIVHILKLGVVSLECFVVTQITAHCIRTQCKL